MLARRHSFRVNSHELADNAQHDFVCAPTDAENAAMISKLIRKENIIYIYVYDQIYQKPKSSLQIQANTPLVAIHTRYGCFIHEAHAAEVL